MTYVLTPTLVRGLDYYTRTTFEFVGPFGNANSTICGGGRYDELVEAIGGPPTPGIGFGAGIERLLLALENEDVAFEAAPLDVFVVRRRRRVPGGALRGSCSSSGARDSPPTPITPDAPSRAR